VTLPTSTDSPFIKVEGKIRFEGWLKKIAAAPTTYEFVILFNENGTDKTILTWANVVTSGVVYTVVLSYISNKVNPDRSALVLSTSSISSHVSSSYILAGNNLNFSIFGVTFLESSLPN
jgi:hypothetical protein